MENENQMIGKIKLLPHVYKAIGFTVAAIAIGAKFFMLHLAKQDYFDKETATILHMSCLSVLVIGMLVAATSRDKVEDEMVHSMRLVAFFAAFIYCALQVALEPVFFFFNIERKMTAMVTVLSMLGFYHLIFLFMKRKVRHEKHD